MANIPSVLKVSPELKKDLQTLEAEFQFEIEERQKACERLMRNNGKWIKSDNPMPEERNHLLLFEQDLRTLAELSQGLATLRSLFNANLSIPLGMDGNVSWALNRLLKQHGKNKEDAAYCMGGNLLPAFIKKHNMELQGLLQQTTPYAQRPQPDPGTGPAR